MPSTMTGKELHEWLTSQGFTPQAATGIVGNLQAESGLNAKANQPNGPGRGIAQWSEGGRWDQLVAEAKKQRRDPEDINMQLWFMKHEMQQSGLWDRLKKVKDERTATRIFLKEYERPADQSEDAVTRRLSAGKSASTGAEDLSGNGLPDFISNPWDKAQGFIMQSGKVVGLSVLGGILLIIGVVVIILSSRAAKSTITAVAAPKQAVVKAVKS